MTHLYRRVTRVWLESADILDVSTCDDRRPRARSSLWPVGLWPVRVRLGFLSPRSVAAVRSSSRVFPGCRSDPFVTVHPRSCIAATMTTIWRPHPLNEPVIPVKEEVPDDDVLDVKVKPPAGDDPADDDDEKNTDLEGKEPDVLVCPITPEAEPAPVLALDEPPRKSKKRQGGKPSAGARARKNKKKRAKFKENGGVRPDGTPRPTRNDRRKKAKTRREAEAQAAVRAIVSPDERAGGDLAAHVAEGVGPPPQ